MLLDLKFSIGTLGIGAGTFVAGLYGMNVKNFFEESDFAFGGVSGFAVVFSALICTYGLRKLRRTQRLSMWGEGGAEGKRGWLSLGGKPSKSKGKPKLTPHLPVSNPLHHHPHAMNGPQWPPVEVTVQHKKP